jgi:hypothetical protein
MSDGSLVDVTQRVARNYGCVQEFDVHSMNRHVLGRPGAAARMMIAALLAGAFMCAALPLASVSAGNVCRLECCAARAPHAAGSCMNGTCHASLNLHRHEPHRLSVVPADEFCGLRILAKRLRYIAKSIDTPAAHESVVALARPCNADCGSCAVSSISAKDKITITDTYRWQSPRMTWSIESNLVSSYEVSRRQYSPRGPPTNSI